MDDVQYDEFSLIRMLTEGREANGGEQVPDRPGLADVGTNVADKDVLVGIGDDAAVMRWTDGERLVMTCDAMVERVHFHKRTMSAHAVGYKALAGTISDLAAMGATGKFATVTLVVPREYSAEWLRECYDGLYACAQRYGIALVGGDTVATETDLVISVNAVGGLPAGEQALTRGRARPGDAVFVTGYPGLSGAGLHGLLARLKGTSADQKASADERMLVEAHQYPQPQMLAGRLFAVSGLVRALNDVSDGVASEAWEIIEASAGCGMVLEEAWLPIHPVMASYGERVGVNPLDWFLFGGEDYQLLGTVGEADWAELARLCAQQSIQIAKIGAVTDQAGVVNVRAPDGSLRPLAKRGYNHFR